jgi:hypothetical protein
MKCQFNKLQIMSLGRLRSRSEIPWKSWNVVLKKRWRRSVGPIVWEKKYCIETRRRRHPTNNKKKEGKLDWFHLPRNCHLQGFIEGKIEGRIKVTGRRGRRPKNLWDDFREKRGYVKLKEETVDRALWKSRWEEAMDLS